MRRSSKGAAFWGGHFILAFVIAGAAAGAEPPRVRLLATPAGGIQPQAVIDQAGTIHLVYLKGDPAAADVFYTYLRPGNDRFSQPLRVNSQPGSAIAMGTIRGAQLALGRGGRLHVAWNGSQKARPRNPIKGSPMLYTRSDPGRTVFEPQRNLMTASYNLDGGGTVAADTQGHVFVAWHAHGLGGRDGEIGRRLWVARSDDDGKTFSSEEPAIQTETGACGCCGARALADRKGNVFVLYRAATEGVDRDMYLATSHDHGRSFQAEPLDRWRFNQCPMSSESLAEGPKGVLAAWETKGEVYLARIDPSSAQASAPLSPPGGRGDRKHPAIATNHRGETLLAWTEGTGWEKGGDLFWQVYSPSGEPEGLPGRISGGIPTWGLPTVVALADGSFSIIH